MLRQVVLCHLYEDLAPSRTVSFFGKVLQLTVIES
jgi:hypothetical protein